MSLKALRKAVKGSNRDKFDDGTVVKWTASGRYAYAALKTPVGWYTTPRPLHGVRPMRGPHR